MKIKERISHEPSDPDAWVCICGNTPLGNGFLPCDEDGKETVPDLEWKELYVCNECGKIISSKTLEVVGKNLSQNSTINI